MMIQNLMTTPPTPRQELDFRLAATVSNLLVIVNSSSNFILYSSLSTKFRRTARQLFCARCRRAAAATPPTKRTAAGGLTTGAAPGDKTTSGAAPGLPDGPCGAS